MEAVDRMLKSFSALIITGGSSGIGKSFIEHAATVHPDLVIFNLSRRFPSIKVPDSVAEKVKQNLRHFSADLSKPEQIEQACALVEAQLNREVPAGRVMLVNNSGYGTYGPFCEPNLPVHLEMLELNMRAPVELAGRFLPILKARGGAIINVASTAAFQPTAGMATYGATKAFVLHWSLALGHELQPYGVQVLALCPGPTKTHFFANAGLDQPVIPGGLGETPEAVVRTALRALARGKPLVVSGWSNKLTTALASKLPKALATRLAARVIAHFRPSGGRSG